MPEIISNWNKHNSSHMEGSFEFKFAYFIDNVYMFVMIPKIKVIIEDVMTTLLLMNSQL